MKSKTIFAGVLTAAISMSLMTGCAQGGQNGGEHSSKAESKTVSAASAEQSTPAEQSSKPEESSAGQKTDGKLYTLTIRDSSKSSKMTAQFINTMSGASQEIPMTKTDEASGDFIYTCEADTSKYNMVHLDYGAENPTRDVAFNEYISGWYLTNGLLKPYVVGKEPRYDSKVETKTFQFDGYDKNVYIWTPEDYDPKSPEKYSTIYAFDGQWTVSDTVFVNDENEESWHIGEHLTSMMAVTDKKAIVVGIETKEETRNNELIPDLGEMAIKNYPSTKRGSAFADFLCDTVIPYIESNYHVYADAEHTAVTGSSLGGLAAFYTAMAHPEHFGTAGALSPSFWTYDVKNWTQWLLPRMSGKNPP